MSGAFALLVAHVLALGFGLVGMLVMIPNPSLWAGSPILIQVFAYSMRYAGALHIVLGALAMLAFGVRVLGWRATLTFFGTTYLVSLGSELLGTGTGWPFGAYEYTEGLGYKVAGRVPYTIPLSWFYMGFASYLLGSAIASRLRASRSGAWSVLLGSWLLLVWDLVLDPAMAHESLPIQFWVWHQTGPYFGMPLQNLIGWFGTGLAFMALSRAVWGRDVGIAMIPPWYSLAVYAVNMLFAIVLSACVALWTPIVASLVLGLGPAMLASRPRSAWPAPLAGRESPAG